MSWYKVINETTGLPKIVVNGYIGVQLDEEAPVLFSDFRNEFVNLEKSNKRCELFINSKGGDMTTAFAMYDLIKNSPMICDVVIYGMAASAAAWLALAGDSVSMAENAMFMLHKPQAGTGGESDNLRSLADYMDKLENRMAEIVSKKCGKPVDAIKAEWLKPNTETWFNAQEALDAGLIDTIIKPVHQSGILVNNWKSADDAWSTYEAFNTSLPPNKPETNTQKTMDIKAIINVLNAQKVQHSLTETSSDADVQAVLNSVLQNNATLQSKVEALEAGIAADKKAKATILVENAVKAGKITEEEKAEWQKNAEGNYDFVANVLEKMQGRVDVNNTLTPGVTSAAPTENKPAADPKNSDTWTLRDWEKKNPDGLKAMMVQNKAKYDQLFEAEYGVKP